jgi:hypothetical protein
VAYNFQIRSSNIKMLTEYESVNQKVFIWQCCTRRIDAWKKIYDVITQNSDCSRESNVRTLVFGNKVRYQTATSLQNSI